VDITSRECLSSEPELFQDVAFCIKDFLPSVSEVERVDIEDRNRFLAPRLLQLVHIVDYCHDIFDLPRGLLDFGCNKQGRGRHSDQITSQEGLSEVKSVQDGLSGRYGDLR
jgi:hypothetical protein